MLRTSGFSCVKCLSSTASSWWNSTASPKHPFRIIIYKFSIRRSAISMHIRVQTYRDKSGNARQGKSVSLLRYAYDRAKKRSGQVVLGTVDYWAKTLPTELESILTDAEREEFREWIAERDRQLAEYKQKSHLLHAAEHMGWAAKALAAGVGQSSPDGFGMRWTCWPKRLRRLGTQGRFEHAGVRRRAKRRRRMILSPTPTMIRCWLASRKRCMSGWWRYRISFQTVPLHANQAVKTARMQKNDAPATAWIRAL